VSGGDGGLDRSTLVLTEGDVRELLPLEICIEAVEHVLALHARGEASAPVAVGLHTEGGGFHVKAAAARLGRFYFAAKTNGNFPGNPTTWGLPTIQGVIVLSDAGDGRPLALLDSMEVTTLRTGAATGVAAKYLARPDSATATVVGCGIQGRVQTRSLTRVLPIERIFAFDADEAVARAFAVEMTEALGVPVTVADHLRTATLRSDVIVTCTPSKRPLLGPDDVPPGAFVAAVGADHPEKHEIHPELFRSATVVTDSIDQCATFGDLHHAIAAGVVGRDVVHANLGEIVIGARPGRSSAEEVVLFDSTGTALQDVAAAAVVFERAVESGRGLAIVLAG